MKRLLPIALVSLALGTACGGKNFDESDIIDQPLQGTLNGEAWELASAGVSVDPFDETELSFDLLGEDGDACGFNENTSPYVIFSLPAEEGVYPLSLSLTDLEGSRTITYVVPPSDNYIVTNGAVTVDAISDTEITVGIVGYVDDDFELNGTFTTEFCPEG